MEHIRQGACDIVWRLCIGLDACLPEKDETNPEHVKIEAVASVAVVHWRMWNACGFRLGNHEHQWGSAAVHMHLCMTLFRSGMAGKFPPSLV